MNIKNIGIIIVSVFVYISAQPSFAGTGQSVYDKVITGGTIRCGYFSWPPYISVDPNTKKISGINYDFMEAIGKVLDLKIEWVEEVSAGTAIEGLNNNRYDVMCATLWPDAARLKNAQLSIPTFYNSAYAVVRANDTRFDGNISNADNNAVKIAALDGDVTYSLAKEISPKAQIFALPQTADASLLLQSVVSKKADITYIDKGMMQDFNKTNPGSLKTVKGLPPVRLFPETLAVKKDEVALRLLLDNAIRILIDTGKAEEIKNKYPEYGFFAPVKGYGIDK